MTTIKLNKIFFLTFLLAFSVTNAFTKNEITDLCNNDNDPPSCVALLEKDPQVGTAPQMTDVLIIVISMLKKETTDGTVHLNAIRPQFYDPNGKKQIDICVKNYGIAATNFETATNMASKKSYAEVNRLMDVGYKFVEECKLTMGTPQQTTPIELKAMNIARLSSIVDVLIEKLSSP